MRGVNGVKQKCFVKIGLTFINMEYGEIQPPQSVRLTGKRTQIF
jgi:hypothetical protein